MKITVTMSKKELEKIIETVEEFDPVDERVIYNDYRIKNNIVDLQLKRNDESSTIEFDLAEGVSLFFIRFTKSLIRMIKNIALSFQDMFEDFTERFDFGETKIYINGTEQNDDVNTDTESSDKETDISSAETENE